MVYVIAQSHERCFIFLPTSSVRERDGLMDWIEDLQRFGFEGNTQPLLVDRNVQPWQAGSSKNAFT